MKAFQIVTIEREYASGGTQVGRLLGKALGCLLYTSDAALSLIHI